MTLYTPGNFDSQFLDLMTSTIGLQNVIALSTDGYGGKVFGAPTLTSTSGSTSGAVQAISARIEQSLKLVKSKEGNDVWSVANLIVAPYDQTTGPQAVVIGVTDRIMLPAGFSPLTPSSSAYLPPIITTSLNQYTGAWEIYI